MEYVVKVHYKSDPVDLIWTYSGTRYNSLDEAVKEASKAIEKPHINKVFISGTGTPDQREPENTDLDKAIEECIDSVEKLIQATNTIGEMPSFISLGSVFCTVLDDYIRQKRLTVEEAVLTLEGTISSIRKYGGKI